MVKISTKRLLKINSQVLAAFILCATLSIPASSPAALCPYKNKTEAEMKKIECPGAYCADDYIGEITKHLLAGDCDPVGCGTTGIGMYACDRGTQAVSVSHYTAGTGPSANGVPDIKLTDLPANAASSLPNILNQDGSVKSSPAVVNPNLNQAQVCTPTQGGSIPALACGGAVPLQNSFNNVASGTGVGSMINIGNNIFIAAPSPVVTPGAVDVVDNKQATGSCAPSQFQLSPNVVSLILPPATAPTPLVSATVTYQSNAGVLELPGTDSITLDLSKVGIINVPEGGQFTLPNGDTFFLKPGADIISYGDGTIALPMQGPVPPILPNGTQLDNPAYYQQSLVVPGNVQNAITNMYDQNLLPDYSVRFQEDYYYDEFGSRTWVSPHRPQLSEPAIDQQANLDNLTNSDIAATVPTGTNGYPQLIGYHITYPNKNQPLVLYTKSIKSYNVNGSSGNTTLVNVNQTINTSNIAAPQGASLSIPQGTPITFLVNTPGTLNVLSQGTIQVPAGSVVNGQTLTDATQISVPQGTTLTSGGNGDITFPGTTIQFPAGTASASILATMIGLPPGASVPVKPGGSVVTPQTPGQPQQQPAC